MTPLQENIPHGYCHCGCGSLTNLAKQTDVSTGYVKGQPRKFIATHQNLLKRTESRIVIVEGKECRTIPLTKGFEAIVDVEDFETISQFPWLCYTRKTKNFTSHYAVRRSSNIMLKMHSVILATADGMEPDHCNRNGLDNRRTNLRLATRQQNNSNRRFHSREGKVKASLYRGVWRDKKGRWVSTISINHKSKHLGIFADEIEAAKAYDREALTAFGRFATLNFPQ